MSRVWLVVMLMLVCFVSMIDAVLAGVAGTQTWFWASVRIAALVALVVSALRPAPADDVALPAEDVVPAHAGADPV
jgi:hypothetical protein